MCSIFDRICCSSWTTHWTPDEALKENFPPRHSDYRDMAPPDMASVYAAHQSLIQEGKWTFGLFECWCPKVKMVKHSTHLPCWDSFKINPCRWRGIVFGRTLEECYWDGLRQTRWARTVYAANLGREYILPVRGVGRHGVYQEMRELTIRGVDGPGLHILDVLPGSYAAAPGGLEAISIRKAAVDKMLSKPPLMFVSRPKNDTKTTSTQGKTGKFVNDKTSKVVVERLDQEEEGEVPNVTLEGLKQGTAITLQRMKGALLGREASDDLDTGSIASDDGPFGWTSNCTVVPCVQEMSRELPRTQSLPTLQSIFGVEDIEGGGAGQLNDVGRRNTLERSWSVVY